MATSSSILLLAALLALVSWQAIASDPGPLQDFCVADMHSPVRVNGFVCKNPMEVNADDFFKAANLDKPRVTNKVGSNVTLINVMQIAGLNTLGISIARIDYAPLGQNPPHTHPRATEILTVLEGTLYVGFVTSNQPAPNRNKFFSKVLNKGDVFVFPVGLIHFQFNPNPHQPAVAIAALAARTQGLSQLPMQCLGQTHQYQMMFLPRHFRWKRIQLTISRLSSGRTTTTKTGIC
ncbi:germin-like protein 8-5 [Triticum aestivum]|nr:germin-like protein 8-5 [Triticum aestivum]